ncbi:cation diffusion facilitator family transporter [Adhaeribacter swui]|uniref:Cation diffusion facilitator family transporter n=1 Tax=Adhaeribacter swui TaxID=2086471 RepID=A0A7G7G8Y7_9BACT|nr:cation diffusion facilitator family transporter [Adhaeribacter swui]QNF33621.1 cation diffusion facilitator family transporter [Adhaeribacter swui]
MAASKVPLYSALAANLAIAITKFIAAGVTGSSAMISEGIHSVVDTANEVLLLYGIHRSNKPADARRPFGYGKELYFWAFIVSILIFGIGGGISFYEGISHLQHPNLIEDPKWNYIVLGFAFLFDGASYITAQREFTRQRAGTPFWRAVRQSKDPSTFVVLFEDAADLLGLTVAFLGVFLGHYYQNPYFDAMASIIIGLILTTISALLLRESRSLLMGETADETLLAQVVQLALENPAVVRVDKPLSMHMGPEEIIVLVPLTFQEDILSREITVAIKDIRQSIQSQLPNITQLYIEPQIDD